MRWKRTSSLVLFPLTIDGMLHLASTAPRACSTWLPQRHRQTSLDAVVRTAAPPSRNAPPATIRRRAVLQVCPVDASSSCLVPAKRTAVSLLPHPSRSHPFPSAGHHLLLLQAVPHPPIPAADMPFTAGTIVRSLPTAEAVQQCNDEN
ncbi:uncharacterized protein LOC119312594 [Triticum dicoccoides]|uniref:uncharacterized protein LOC119312594 n=1 Tax=Triticum dicoccoides TaxID=85692 RepID=UPI001891A125|nr:uncharacterized protein LOC119312594 [Triticum dicoccoides]